MLLLNFCDVCPVVTAPRDYRANWIICALSWMTRFCSRTFTDTPSTSPGWERAWPQSTYFSILGSKVLVFCLLMGVFSSLVWFLCRIKISAVLIWTLQKPCWHFSLEGRGLCSQFSTNFWRFVIFFFKSRLQICCQAPDWMKKHYKSLILPLFFVLWENVLLISNPGLIITFRGTMKRVK